MSFICLVITIMSYMFCKKLNQRWNLVLLHPLLICPMILIGLITATSIPVEQYASSTKLLSFCLGPATVAFAVPIYKNLDLIKKHSVEILLSLMSGTILSVISSAVFSDIAHLSTSFMNSLMPRSITTPIAIEVSREIGGLPALTAVFVIFTGITGAIVGPILIRFFAFRSSVAKGLMLGTAAHGTGTAKAFEFGDKEGTFSSIAMVIGAMFTLLWANSWIPFLQHIL